MRLFLNKFKRQKTCGHCDHTLFSKLKFIRRQKGFYQDKQLTSRSSYRRQS